MNVLKRKLVVLILVSMAAACTGPMPQDNTDLDRAAEVNAQLGNAYLAQGRLDIAKAKFEKALEQDPDLPAAHAGYGLLLGRLGQNKQAEHHFSKALREDPNNPDILNNYGTFLCGQNRIDEAEKQFLAALKDPLYKTPEYAYTNAGRCSMKLHDYERAETYFNRALQINPKFPDALYQMAVLYNTKGNPRLAYAYLQKFDEYGIHNPETLWLGIGLARYVGDRDTQASFELLLKNQFPDSRQAAALQRQRY